MSTRLVQLSDLHIREPGKLAYGRLDTSTYLEKAVQTVLALKQPADAMIITGDLTDFGRPAEYEHLKRLLAPLSCPVHLMMGNHDEASALRSAFKNQDSLGTSGPVQYSIEIGELQLIALDTTVSKQPYGSLSLEALQWLEIQLIAVQHRPVIVAMHHPPFKTLIGHMDNIGLLNGADQLEQLLSRFTNIERVIGGHLHRSIEVRFGGTIASTCPSPAHQVVLDIDQQAQSQWNLEPGGFKVHVWDSQSRVGTTARLVTHQVPVGVYPGPFPFHDGGVLID
jgi:3',5'-cyclic-AMP phosphodiesterase